MTDYRYRFLRKRGGGERVIAEPLAELKARQRVIARVLRGVATHDAAHAFVRGRSVTTALAPHVAGRVLVRIDIADFYGSIRAERIASTLADVGLSSVPLADVVDPLSRALPQGAPTSPAIANIVARGLDVRCAAIAAAEGFAYTRYADDLLFSSDDDTHVARLVRRVRSAAAVERFSLAERKTRIMVERRAALGLVLTDRARLPRKLRSQLRCGVFNAERGMLDARALEKLRGELAHANAVDPEWAGPLLELVNRCTGGGRVRVCFGEPT